MSEPSDQRILFLIKSRGAQSAEDIGRRLSMTAVGARKHLAKLEARGLVVYKDQRARVGRPRRTWSLTEKGHGRFPDSHSHLTLELLGSLKSIFGEDGLERLIADREQATVATYRKALAGCKSLRGRVARLARLRSQEGYMAEVERGADGALLLVENHCPICAAAKACQGLCRSELAVFAAALGPNVTVTRIEHILAGARRCAYRIAPADEPTG
ncbi:MAG: metalloregulator ArsR/SmtB family transcription factor [Pseudomonadota bacterium]